MLQPRDARCMAIARPIPRLAPVITATFPVRSSWRVELCGRRKDEGMLERRAVGARVIGDQNIESRRKREEGREEGQIDSRLPGLPRYQVIVVNVVGEEVVI